MKKGKSCSRDSLLPGNESLYDKIVKRERVRQYIEKRESIDVRKYMTTCERELGLGSKAEDEALALGICCVHFRVVLGIGIWMNEREEAGVTEIAQTTIEPGKKQKHCWF